MVIKTDGNQKMPIVTIGAVLVVLAMTVVTANLLTSHTPLYMVRMEQMSSKMIFLPTVTNEFTYVTQKGVKVDYRCPNQNNSMVIHGNQIV